MFKNNEEGKRFDETVFSPRIEMLMKVVRGLNWCVSAGRRTFDGLYSLVNHRLKVEHTCYQFGSKPKQKTSIQKNVNLSGN